jgi:hypothetical protein
MPPAATRKKKAATRLPTSSTTAPPTIPSFFGSSSSTTSSTTKITGPSEEEEKEMVRSFLVNLLSSLSSSPKETIPENTLLLLRGYIQDHPNDQFLSGLEKLNTPKKWVECIEYVLSPPEDDQTSPQRFVDRLLQYLRLSMDDNNSGKMASGAAIRTVEEMCKFIADSTVPSSSQTLHPGMTKEEVETHLRTLPFLDVMLLGLIKERASEMEEVTSMEKMEEMFKQIVKQGSLDTEGQRWDHCIFYDLFHASKRPLIMTGLVGVTGEEMDLERKSNSIMTLEGVKQYVRECIFYPTAKSEISYFDRIHSWDFMDNLLKTIKDEDTVDMSVDTLVVPDGLVDKFPAGKRSMFPEFVWNNLKTVGEWELFLREARKIPVSHPDILFYILQKVQTPKKTDVLHGFLREFLLSIGHPITRKKTVYGIREIGVDSKNSTKKMEIEIIKKKGFKHMGIEELREVIVGDKDLLKRFNKVERFSVDIYGKEKTTKKKMDVDRIDVDIVEKSKPRLLSMSIPLARKIQLLKTQPWLEDLSVQTMLLQVMEEEGHNIKMESPWYTVDENRKAITDLPKSVVPSGGPLFYASDSFLGHLFYETGDLGDVEKDVPQTVYHRKESSEGIQEWKFDRSRFRVYFLLTNGLVVHQTYEMYRKQQTFFQRLMDRSVDQQQLSMKSIYKIEADRWAQTPVGEFDVTWMSSLRKKEVNKLKMVLSYSPWLQKKVYHWDYEKMAQDMERGCFGEFEGISTTLFVGAGGRKRRTTIPLVEYWRRLGRLELLFSVHSIFTTQHRIFIQRLQNGMYSLDRLGEAPLNVVYPEIFCFSESIQVDIRNAIDRFLDHFVKERTTDTLPLLFPELMMERKRTRPEMFFENMIPKDGPFYQKPDKPLPFSYPQDGLQKIMRDKEVQDVLGLVWDTRGRVYPLYPSESLPEEVKKEIQQYFDNDLLEMGDCGKYLMFSSVMKYLVGKVERKSTNLGKDQEKQKDKEKEEEEKKQGESMILPKFEEYMVKMIDSF